MIIAEKGAVIRIGDVRVNTQRVEVIRKVETAHRKTQRVFRVDLDVLQDPRVGGKIVRKPRPVAVRRPDVVAQRIYCRIRKSRAIFEDRQQLQVARQIHPSPRQEPVRHVPTEVRENIVANQRQGEVAEVTAELVQGPLGAAAGVSQKELLALLPLQAPRDRELPVGRAASAHQQ